MATTVCSLGHRQRSYECPACAEAITGETQPIEAWRWFRTRTSSKRIKALIDEYLKQAESMVVDEVETAMRDCDELCPDCGSRTCELVSLGSGERIHLYCMNTECDRNKWL